MTDQLVDVEVQATSVVSLAMVHNRVPLVRAIRLTNHGGERRGAAVRVAIHDDEGRLSRPWEALVDLPEDGSVELTEVDLRMDGEAMLQLEERRPGTVRVAVEHHDVEVQHDDTVLGTWQGEVMVLAGRQWLNQPPGLALEMLAAHVMPNSPEIAELLAEASDLLEQRTGSGSIEATRAGPSGWTRSPAPPSTPSAPTTSATATRPRAGPRRGRRSAPRRRCSPAGSAPAWTPRS